MLNHSHQWQRQRVATMPHHHHHPRPGWMEAWDASRLEPQVSSFLRHLTNVLTVFIVLQPQLLTTTTKSGHHQDQDEWRLETWCVSSLEPQVSPFLFFFFILLTIIFPRHHAQLTWVHQRERACRLGPRCILFFIYIRNEFSSVNAHKFFLFVYWCLWIRILGFTYTCFKVFGLYCIYISVCALASNTITYTCLYLPKPAYNCLLTYSPNLDMMTYIGHTLTYGKYIGRGNLWAYSTYVSLSSLHRYYLFSWWR
jgi:hypothetical protein